MPPFLITAGTGELISYGGVLFFLALLALIAAVPTRISQKDEEKTNDTVANLSSDIKSKLPKYKQGEDIYAFIEKLKLFSRYLRARADTSATINRENANRYIAPIDVI